ncbi:hypothetical protein [Neobacillus mesonae]|uniref:Uncharacterized protein n=1 Tax=Neobacillus mesonae TaxID=1193713 RepID=A0A3Q9QVQ8_9BACI|nr:hypothetical protein [Neobacillus mesonae]AZU61617.1 hypothetical protein CHR53_10205 [Neobacillus mesonae]MED4205317.1 hypothetical protein [Neobacillus mesonae]
MAIPVGVGAINIIMQNTNSSVSVGENQISGWSAHRKTNNGVGNQAGFYVNISNLSLIWDNDLNDGQIIDPDIIPGLQTQAL